MAVVQQLGGSINLLNNSSSKHHHAGFTGSRLASRGLIKRAAPRIVQSVRAVKTEEEDVLPSGQWPESFSMLNYEDLTAHLAPTLFKEEAQPATLLADVMSGLRFSATEENLLEEIDHFFEEVSGVPVLDKDRKCVGVISKKDREKATNGLKSKVSEVMSSPAIMLKPSTSVSDAAVLMLKKKIHRIPIVNKDDQVIGMVTRTDIFTALEHHK